HRGEDLASRKRRSATVLPGWPGAALPRRGSKSGPCGRPAVGRAPMRDACLRWPLVRCCVPACVPSSRRTDWPMADARGFSGTLMSVYSGQLKQVSSEQLRFLSGRNKKATLLWIECGSCNGESMAILGAEGPGKTGDNLSDFLEDGQVRLLW